MRRLFALVATVLLVDTMFLAALAPLLPSYVDELGISKAAAGVLSASYPAGTLLASLPSGWVAARIGVRPTMLVGLALLGVSSLAFAFGDTIVVLDLARFAQGIGGAFAWTAGLAWLIGAAPSDRRGELIGAAMAAAIGGVLFGPVLGGAAVALGRGPVFGGVALLGLVMIALTRRLPVPRPSLERSARESLTAAVAAPAVRLGLVLILIPGLLFGTVDVLVPLRLDELGATAGAIAAVFIVAALAEGAVNPVAGRLSDRYGRLAPSKVGLATSAVAAGFLILPETAWVLGVIMIAAAPAIGVLWSPAIALLSDGAERAGVAQGLAFGFVNLGWALGHTLGSAIGPALAEATSDGVTYAVLAAICAGALAALAFRDPIPEPA
jgi:MFS family permease